MLSVAKVLRGREAYYLSTVAAGGDEPPGLVEPEGAWVGRGAAALGLAGSAVEAPGLRAVLRGVHPVTGELLDAAHGRVQVTAFDCTFSTPKSVSILHALGPGDAAAEARAGHEASMQAALDHLERDAARVRRQVGRERASLAADGLVGAAFVHRTSRAPDPHLHSHVLVANLAAGPDGRWSALDARALYCHVSTARALYELQLRYELTRRLGVAWRSTRGVADIVGLPPEVLRAFSRRSAAIAAELAASGRSGPLAARHAAERTRPPKDLTVRYDVLVERWRERAYDLGVSDGRLAGLGSDGASAPPAAARAPAGPPPGALERAVAALPGPFTRRQLVRAASRALPEGAPAAALEGAVDALLADVALVRSVATGVPRRLGGGRNAPFPAGHAEALYATVETIEREERLLRLLTGPDGPAVVGAAAGAPFAALAALGERAAGMRGAGMTVLGLAADERRAAHLEATTGIECASLARAGPLPLDAVAVVLDADRLAPRSLEALALEAGRRRAHLVLVVSAGEAASAWGPGASPRLRDALRQLAAEPQRTKAGTPSYREAGTEAHRVGDVEVVLAEGLPAAVGELIARARTARLGGEDAVIVTADRGGATWLARVAAADEAPPRVDARVDAPPDVPSARVAGRTPPDGELPLAVAVAELDAVLERAPGTRLFVLGGARLLGRRLSRVPDSQRVHVAVRAGRRDLAERVGLAAEQAAARQVVRAIGRPPPALAERAEWRRRAGTLDASQRPDAALGPARPSRALRRSPERGFGIG
ncbi:MAG TPA: MobF family relaxase [Acidimicrobiales bacterium]|nr:MobF family relaxase [Acidimicrobiales bacterium]